LIPRMIVFAGWSNIVVVEVVIKFGAERTLTPNQPNCSG
jgi:hypothetical protein